MNKAKQKDDIFYVCSLLEYIARKTKNRRADLMAYFMKSDIERMVRLAEVNHCLSFEQVSDEVIEEYDIKNGNYDTVAECKYTVPSAQAIGRVYQELIYNCSTNEDYVQTLQAVFRSFISDEISDFNSNVYYSNPDYLKWSYLEGELLA